MQAEGRGERDREREQRKWKNVHECAFDLEARCDEISKTQHSWWLQVDRLRCETSERERKRTHTRRKSNEW